MTSLPLEDADTVDAIDDALPCLIAETIDGRIIQGNDGDVALLAVGSGHSGVSGNFSQSCRVFQHACGTAYYGHQTATITQKSTIVF